MITPAFSLTATERVLPKLTLDFTTASLDQRITFTRGLNTATRINSNGDIETVNADIPRFDYDPSTLVCKGLLIEESRTNSIANNTMVGAVAGTPGTNPNSWGYLVAGTGLTKTIVGTGTENGIDYIDVSISGTAGANAAIAAAFSGITITAANGQSWTNSVYLKLVSGSLSGIQLQLGIIEFTSGGGFVSGANYNISSPTTDSLITQRYSATRTLSGGATVERVQPTLNSVCTAGATINFTLRIGLPQMEQGAFLTSVIKTSTAAVTRNADVATMTGTNFSNWFDRLRGAFLAETSTMSFAANRALWAVGDPTLAFGSSETMFAIYSSSAAGAIQFNSFDGGALQASLTPAVAQTINVKTKSVFAYALNNYGASVSASAVTTGAGSLPTETAMSIGSLVSGWNGATQYLNGHIAKLFYYAPRITNAEVQAFSK